jgi:cyanophycinase-like exopeptidase
MGSGELTPTMVEVHKELIAQLNGRPSAAFLDTPAGFQLNVDQLSKRAAEFFKTHVEHPLTVISFKSKESTSPSEAEQAFRALRAADYILMGPGSPTYAIRQWAQTPIPDILVQRIQTGGCLVAASAAALTVGRFTLPVYEIYKVGDALHWVDGLDILSRFGCNLVVVPHWNNAEGGTHDTRFCFMGELRFRTLESQLPDDVCIFGLDEHTACIIDFDAGEAFVRGLGSITLRSRGTELRFAAGDVIPLDVLRGRRDVRHCVGHQAKQPNNGGMKADRGDAFWDKVQLIERSFYDGIERLAPERITNALLELDAELWKASQEREHEECISQAREILRDMIALLGTRIAALPRSAGECLAPLVQSVLALREEFRRQKKWTEADAVRQCLAEARITIEDTRQGTRWMPAP